MTAVESALEPLGDRALFRGQVRQYLDPTGNPSFMTSFGRFGCQPEHMLKWTFYAQEILRALGAPNSEEFDIARNQALLQHYGWRSFFIDATSSWNVAAWFACHQHTTTHAFEMVEDCFELGILAAHQCAEYKQVPDDEIGHIFAIDMDELQNAGIQAVDLRAVTGGATEPRFVRQQAWLVGPLSSQLPSSAIVAHIEAPARVLASVAVDAGLNKSVLFPSREEDVVLRLLLSTPWERAGENPAVFRRSLSIPEYDFRHVKRYPPNVAFVQPFWVDDMRANDNKLLPDAAFYRTSQSAYFGTEHEPRPLIQIRELLGRHPQVIVEIDGLALHPELAHASEYSKGIAIERAGEDGLEISELAIDHPGTQVAGIAVTNGWSYLLDTEGRLRRVPSSSDCPCGNHLRHARHLGLIYWLEECLVAAKCKQLGELSNMLPI